MLPYHKSNLSIITLITGGAILCAAFLLAGQHLIIALTFSWLGFYLAVLSCLSSELKMPSAWLVVITVALLLRFFMWMLPPIESNDFIRYLFDGKLLDHGINSYAVMPLEYPGLGGLELGRPEVKTIYPPLAEFLFWLGYRIDDSVMGLRILNGFADIGCIYLISRILVLYKLPAIWLTFYLWNPIVLKEFINSVHIDHWVLFFLLGFIYSWKNNKIALATLTITLSMLIKIVPGILLIPIIQSQTSLKKKSLLIIFAIALTALAFVPFIPHTPFQSLFKFYTHIEGYSALFTLLTVFISPEIARLLLSSLGGSVLFYLLFYTKAFNLKRSGTSSFIIFELFLLIFVFSSMGFPWYLAGALPLIFFTPNIYLLIFMALAQLSYYLPASNSIFNIIFACISTWLIVLLLKPRFKIDVKTE